MKKTVMLIILDGWGYRTETKDNAVASAKKPTFDHLWQTYPHSLLKASGEAVGLPEGQMGNSEVGHMTIGAGRPADTDLVRIDKAIASGEFDKNPAFLELFEHVRKLNSTLHVMGLVSPGGVHSHQRHLFAFLRLAKKFGVRRVAIDVFTDGRDTPPQSGAEYVKELETLLAELNSDDQSNRTEPQSDSDYPTNEIDSNQAKPHFFISTISGRFYAMDRDHNWDRLALVEKAIFEGKGNICETTPSAYLNEQYKKEEKDELLPPTVCKTPYGQGCPVAKNDGIFFFNFRPDRARMLAENILKIPVTQNLMFVTMTEYRGDFKSSIAFPPLKIKTTLGQEIAKAGLKQTHIAETEKFAHATYFLNGGRETPYENERDILLPSRKDIKTHDEAPEMRAEAIADKAIEEINACTDFIFINFANADMVGHTANVPAIITAVETVDTQLGRVIKALEMKGGVALISADHGNAEINIDPITGTKHTSHTTSPVPCIVTSKDLKIHDGELSDIAPTILDLFKLKVPKEMTGKTLIDLT